MFFFKLLIHSRFHPSPSLFITYYPINFFHKDLFPPSLYCTSLHLIPLHFASFTSLYFTSLHFILDNFSLHFRLFTSLLTFHFTRLRFSTLFNDFQHTLLPFNSIITFLTLFLKVIGLQRRFPNTSDRRIVNFLLQKVGPVRLVFRHAVEPFVSFSIWSQPLFEQDVWMKEFNYRRTHHGDVAGCALVRMMGVPVCFILRLLCNITCAETNFRFAAERTSSCISGGCDCSAGCWQPRCAR